MTNITIGIRIPIFSPGRRPPAAPAVLVRCMERAHEPDRCRRRAHDAGPCNQATSRPWSLATSAIGGRTRRSYVRRRLDAGAARAGPSRSVRCRRRPGVGRLPAGARACAAIRPSASPACASNWWACAVDERTTAFGIGCSTRSSTMRGARTWPSCARPPAGTTTRCCGWFDAMDFELSADRTSTAGRRRRLPAGSGRLPRAARRFRPRTRSLRRAGRQRYEGWPATRRPCARWPWRTCRRRAHRPAAHRPRSRRVLRARCEALDDSAIRISLWRGWTTPWSAT